MEGVSDERVLRKLLEHMNAQVPSKRIWLSELEQMAEPCYKSKDGREYAIDRSELATVREALRFLGMSDVKLPIVMFADSSYEVSTWRVEGREEVAVVSRIIDKPAMSDSEKVFLHGPHIAALRRKLPTATICVYVP